MTFYTYWPAKKTLFHFCCNLFKVGHIFVIDCLDYNYNKLKKALLTRYNYTEDGYRKRFGGGQARD